MKRLLPIVMLLFGAPLFAQPRVLIDNRTDHDVDTARVHRMAAEALVNAPVNEPTIVVHIWPRKALRSMTGRKIDAFFVGPNHVFMHDANYLALVQGMLLVMFPDEDVEEIERRGRRIWLMEELVVRVDTLQNAAGSH